MKHTRVLTQNDPPGDEPGDQYINTVALPKPELGALWMHFTKEHDPDKAAASFRERYGYYPKHNMMFLGSRVCGPIEVTR